MRLASRLLSMALVLGVSTAHAELTVVYDGGTAEPLAPYLQVFDALPPDGDAPQARSDGLLGAADPSRLLPIRTPELTPGRVRPRAVSLPPGATLLQPFFLVGADAMSRAWLEAHRDRLAGLQAVGMLVHADTVADLEAIAALAQGLSILPASASDIARVLGLAHIPVLVSSRGIEQ